MTAPDAQDKGWESGLLPVCELLFKEAEAAPLAERGEGTFAAKDLKGRGRPRLFGREGAAEEELLEVRPVEHALGRVSHRVSPQGEQPGLQRLHGHDEAALVACLGPGLRERVSEAAKPAAVGVVGFLLQVVVGLVL